MDRSVVFKGRPLIRCVKGSTLKLCEEARVNSCITANPVSSGRRTALCTVAPGARLVLNKGVGASGVTITAAVEVTVGEGTLLGADCLITDTDFHVPLPGPYWGNDVTASASAVNIGRGCFVGARAMILKGVTIGDGAVIGAGAVVTRDVPANSLATGCPAVVRKLPPQWRHEHLDEKNHLEDR